MHSFKKVATLLLCVILLGTTVLTSCKDEGSLDGQTVEDTMVTVDSVSLNITNLTMQKNSAVDLTATVAPENATGKKMEWTTSDADVAIVFNGTVMAVGEGSAVITASTSNGKNASCQVTVSKEELFKHSKGVIKDLGLNAASLLKNIVIPNTIDGVEIVEVDLASLLSDWRITSVTIPSTVTRVTTSQTILRSGVTSITVAPGNPVYRSEGNCLIETASNTVILGCQNSTIPNGIQSIGENAFANCKELKSITIPNGVTSIGDYAFYGCESLTGITLPEGVSSIGNGAFSHCKKLMSITIPDSVTSIGMVAFSWCEALTSITIPDGVTSIGSGAFSQSKSLESIVIPNSVTSLGERAFYFCTGLTSAVISDRVETIGENMFHSCWSLTDVTIGSGVKYIDRYAFQNTKLNSITIPDGVEKIDDEAFSHCSSLKNITLPTSIKNMGRSIFDRSNLRFVYFCGTVNEWPEFPIGWNNAPLENATVYYYSETTPANTNHSYWHYVDGVPTLWAS